MKKFLSLWILLNVFCLNLFAQEVIQLSGKWQFTIDPQDKGIAEKWFNKSFKETVNLPGSMTENGKGNEITLLTKWTGDILDSSFYKLPVYEKFRQPGNIKIPFWLQPDKYYVGAAWYKREINIPSNWKDKAIDLFFERCHWQSTLWIDDVMIGTQNALSAPHKFDLTGKLSPGKHSITVLVDNRIKDVNPGVNSHSITDHSQTNWNGIIGEMSLTSHDRIYFTGMKLFPDTDKKLVVTEMEINNLTGENQNVKIDLQALSEGSPNPELSNLVHETSLKPALNSVKIEYNLGESALLWDEFTPNLYKMICKLTGKSSRDKIEETFGLRKLETKGTQFTVNGRLTFLRGTLECAIFPKTGYPSTDEKEWTRIFNICKNHGLNHVRFHSWCPPEAAFIAADKVGIYLHAECSSWANQGSSIGDGKPIDKYLYDEAERIINEFGNHPSFCFLLYGNEPAGENQNKFLGDWITHLKSKDKRRLYSSAAGWPQLDVNDFHSMYEPRIQLWGAGNNSIINSQSPGTSYDWYNIINWRGKPVVSHEIGQWCVYPNFKEIKKYDGVLKPRNFELFQETLNDNGMSLLADSFLIASGKLQTICYKAEIEAALRTKGFGGFQLLDLHDFPGQGTALVGVLDAFWGEKGYVKPEEYREFCNTTVPLAKMTKVIFNSAEDFVSSVEAAHFGKEELKDIIPAWQIKDENGNVISKGELNKTNIPIGNGLKMGEIRFPLHSLKSPAMYKLQVNIGEYKNHWDFWIYPYKLTEPELSENIRIVRKLDEETISFLNNGGNVLLTPVKGNIKPEKGGSVAVGFSSIFWNTAWTSGQAPHTLGILCNPKHSLLAEFPTEYHSNFQWWDAMSHSNAIFLNELGKDIQPVVRIIDDWFKNRPLGLIIEAKVGKGKIVLTGIDLITDAERRPEARQLTHSILKYMESNSFNPVQEIQIKQIQDLFK